MLPLVFWRYTGEFCHYFIIDKKENNDYNLRIEILYTTLFPKRAAPPAESAV